MYMKKIILLLCSGTLCCTLFARDPKTRRGHTRRMTQQTPHTKSAHKKTKAIIAQLSTQPRDTSIGLLQDALAMSERLVQEVQKKTPANPIDSVSSKALKSLMSKKMAPNTMSFVTSDGDLATNTAIPEKMMNPTGVLEILGKDKHLGTTFKIAGDDNLYIVSKDASGKFMIQPVSASVEPSAEIKPSSTSTSTTTTTPPAHASDTTPQDDFVSPVSFYNPEKIEPKYKKFKKWQERYSPDAPIVQDMTLPLSKDDITPAEVQSVIQFIQQNHLSDPKYRNALYNKIALYIHKYFTYSKWHRTLKPTSTQPLEISQKMYDLKEMLKICSEQYPSDTYPFYSNGWLSDEPMTAQEVYTVLLGHTILPTPTDTVLQPVRIDKVSDIMTDLYQIEQNISFALDPNTKTPYYKQKAYLDIAEFLENHFEINWAGYIIQKSHVPETVVRTFIDMIKRCASQWPDDEYPFFNLYPLLYSTRSTMAVSHLARLLTHQNYTSQEAVVTPIIDPELGIELPISTPRTSTPDSIDTHVTHIQNLLTPTPSHQTVEAALKYIQEQDLNKTYRDLVYKEISKYLKTHFDIEQGSMVQAEGALTAKEPSAYDQARKMLAACARAYPTDMYLFYDSYQRTAESVISSLYKS